MGDEQGALIGGDLPGLAERVTLVPPHCDPTVNLYDAYHLVAGDTVTGALAGDRARPLHLKSSDGHNSSASSR